MFDGLIHLWIYSHLFYLAPHNTHTHDFRNSLSLSLSLSSLPLPPPAVTYFQAQGTTQRVSVLNEKWQQYLPLKRPPFHHLPHITVSLSPCLATLQTKTQSCQQARLSTSGSRCVSMQNALTSEPLVGACHFLMRMYGCMRTMKHVQRSSSKCFCGFTLATGVCACVFVEFDVCH